MPGGWRLQGWRGICVPSGDSSAAWPACGTVGALDSGVGVYLLQGFSSLT